MNITMNNLRRLCGKTGMKYEEALSLLKRSDGDYRKALRTWKDEHSIFIEPLRVEDFTHPLGDRIRCAWHSVLHTLNRIHIFRPLAALALFILARKAGRWLWLLPAAAALWTILRHLRPGQENSACGAF